MSKQTIPDAEWVAFLTRQYNDEHLFVMPNQLGTVGLIRAIEQFVLSELATDKIQETS